jgi:hypothetical protein
MPTNNQEKWEIDLIEKLSAIEHERWADWQKYVFSKCEVLIDGSTMIPKWAVEQWTRQIETPYDKLTEAEKDSDRREVNRYFPILRQEIRQAKIESLDVAEMLWVVLANVSEGDWTKQTKEWQEAAAKWRDNYLNAISNLKKQ